MDALDAYDLLRFAEQLHERLAAACTAVENKRVIRQEKTWLAAARDLVSADREQARALIERSRMLPELLDVRQEFASTLQQKWVDALEKLVGGITFHAGSRSPMIETLLPHQKFPVLRKAGRDVVTQFQADIERRLKLSYVQRMLTDATFSFVPACVDEIQKAYAEWMTSYSGESMPEDEAQPIRAELVELGEKVELLSRQAKLLAEAALLPIKGGLDEYGLLLKPRKRNRVKKAAEGTESIEVTGTTGDVTATEIEAAEATDSAPVATDEPVVEAAPVGAVDEVPVVSAAPAIEAAPVAARAKKPRKKKTSAAIEAAAAEAPGSDDHAIRAAADVEATSGDQRPASAIE